MTLRKELENEIQGLQDRIAKLQGRLDELNKSGNFIPEEDEFYYFVTAACQVNGAKYSLHSGADIERIEARNSFSTEEEAKIEAEKIIVRRMLESIARRLNRGKKIDWNNLSQNKYYLYCSSFPHSIEIDSVNACASDTVYCLSPDFNSVAIQVIGEERLINYILRR